MKMNCEEGCTRIREVLRKYGRSFTEERQKIFSFLEEKRLCSSQDIQEHFSDIGRASVFRTLNLFLEMGIIRKLALSDRWDTYEFHSNDTHREYMKCESCDSVVSFESEDICKKIFKEAKKNEFVIKQHNISITGLCKTCAHMA